MKSKSLTARMVSYGLLGMVGALITFAALSLTGLTSLAILHLAPSLGATTPGAATDPLTSWLITLVQGMIPSVGTDYIKSLVSASEMLGFLSIPILIIFWGSISALLYEYTYTTNIYALVIVGIKAVITSLISAAVFLGVDLVFKLEVTWFTIVVLFAFKWIFWGWVARNIVGVRIKGWT